MALTSMVNPVLKFGYLFIVGCDDGLSACLQRWRVLLETNISFSPTPRMCGLVVLLPLTCLVEGRVYLSLNGYRWDNFESMIYVSEDYGLTKNANWS